MPSVVYEFTGVSGRPIGPRRSFLFLHTATNEASRVNSQWRRLDARRHDVSLSVSFSFVAS